MSNLIEVKVDEDTGVSLMGRVQGKVSGTTANVTQASITAITYSSTTNCTTTTGTLVVSATIFDTLQTDADWTTDATGYNFRWDVPDTLFASPGVYNVTVLIDPASGSDFKIKWRVQVDGDSTD